MQQYVNHPKYQHQLISIHKIPEIQHEATKIYFRISKTHTNKKVTITTTNTIYKSIVKKQPITYKTKPNLLQKTKNPNIIYQTNNTNNNFQKQKSNKIYKSNIVKTYFKIRLIDHQSKYYKIGKIYNLYRYYFITPNMQQKPQSITTYTLKDNTFSPLSLKQSSKLSHTLPNRIIKTKIKGIKYLITYKKKPKIINKYQHTNKCKPNTINHKHKVYTHIIFSSIHLENIKLP